MEFNELRAGHAYSTPQYRMVIYVQKKDRDINRIDGIYADYRMKFLYRDYWMVSDDWFGSWTRMEELPEGKYMMLKSIFEFEQGNWT